MTFSPLMKPPKYYKKPKPETMKKNRQTYQKLYTDEIKWMKNNLKVVILIVMLVKRMKKSADTPFKYSQNLTVILEEELFFLFGLLQTCQ